MSLRAVMIDRREPAWIQNLSFGGAMTAVTELQYGDLLATTDDGVLLAIERKTPTDLLNSIRDDRLWSQLAGIRATSQWAYLLVTGSLQCGSDGNVVTDSRPTGWSWAALQGALLQVQELGVFVVFASNDADYEPTVARLAARSHQAEIVIPPAREPRILSEAERVLTALPGIGYEKVVPILEYCSNAAWALSYLTHLENQERIPGIGPGTKRAVRRALGLNDDQMLSVIVSDTGNPAIQES